MISADTVASEWWNRAALSSVGQARDNGPGVKGLLEECVSAGLGLYVTF
jgi:hypothetical protein